MVDNSKDTPLTIWSVKEAIFIFLFCIFFGIFFGGVILLLSRYAIQKIGVVAYAVRYIVKVGLLGIVPLIYLRFLKKLPFSAIGFRKCPMRYCVYGAVLALTLFILEKTVKIVFNFSSGNISMDNKLLLAISGGVLLIPVVEEIYYRGVLFSAFKNKFGIIAGLIVSSFFFALMHVRSDQYWLFSFLYAFLVGAVFAWLYHSSGSLLPSIVSHCLLNLTTLVIYPWLLSF